jgi:hypothetical protein
VYNGGTLQSPQSPQSPAKGQSAAKAAKAKKKLKGKKKSAAEQSSVCVCTALPTTRKKVSLSVSVLRFIKIESKK